MAHFFTTIADYLLPMKIVIPGRDPGLGLFPEVLVLEARGASGIQNVGEGGGFSCNGPW